MRDPAGNEERYSEYFRSLDAVEQLLAKDAANHTLAVKVNIAYRDNFNQNLKSPVYRYASGAPLEEMVKWTADSLAKLAANTAFLREHGAEVNPDFTTVVPIRTDDRLSIGFATLALTLLPSAEQCTIVSKHVSTDLTVRAMLPELLLKAFDPTFVPAKKYKESNVVLAWTAPVLRALAQPPGNHAAALAAHMKNWCRLMRPFGWKSDLDTTPGNDSLFADFAFEVALAVCAYDIDDSTLRAHPYYPFDLVDYYRANIRHTRDAWRAQHAGAGVPVTAPPLPTRADLAKSKRKGVARWVELVCDGDVDAIESVLEATGNPRKRKDIWPLLDALTESDHAIHADLRDDATVELACSLLAEARELGQFDAPPAPPAGLARCEAIVEAFTGWMAARGYRLIDLQFGDDSWVLLSVRDAHYQEWADLGSALGLPASR